MSVLSDPALRMPPMSAPLWHPWRALRDREDVTVRWRRMPGRLGHWCADSRTVTFHPGQGQAQRRVTATHEQIHIEWGHDGCQPASIELAVRKETARRCIGIYALVNAVLFYGEHNLPALADELWVDVETVQTRLEYLHPAERGYIQQLLWTQRWGSA